MGNADKYKNIAAHLFERCHHHAVCYRWKNKSNTVAEGETFPMWPQAPFKWLTGACRAGFHILPWKEQTDNWGRKSRGHSGFERAARERKTKNNTNPLLQIIVASDSPGDPAQGPGHCPRCSFPWYSSPWTSLLFPRPCSSVLSISYQHISTVTLSVLWFFPLLRECTGGGPKNTFFRHVLLFC